MTRLLSCAVGPPRPVCPPRRVDAPRPLLGALEAPLPLLAAGILAPAEQHYQQSVPIPTRPTSWQAACQKGDGKAHDTASNKYS